MKSKRIKRPSCSSPFNRKHARQHHNRRYYRGRAGRPWPLIKWTTKRRHNNYFTTSRRDHLKMKQPPDIKSSNQSSSSGVALSQPVSILRRSSTGAASNKKKKPLTDERREERNMREKERSLKITQQIHELRTLLSSGGVIVPKVRPVLGCNS